MPTLNTIEAGISTLDRLSNVSTTTLRTVLSRTLHITSSALLGLEFSSYRYCTALKVRVPQTLLPFCEFGLLTDAKIVSVASITRTCLIMRLWPTSIKDAPLLQVILNLLEMHH